MRKLNFCPYDFEDIKEDNLAYELTFSKGWTWEKVKQETVIGEKRKLYIIEDDDRRTLYFMEANNISHVILREGVGEGSKNGFDLLKEFIKRENAKIEAEEEQEFSRMELDDEEELLQPMKKKIKLYPGVWQGINVFRDEHKRIIINVIPCCPHCHNRLPIGWNEAEDFGAIALMAPSGSGKTTFLLSMMKDNWNAFRNLGGYPDNKYKISIATAHLTDDEKDSTYYEMEKNAEEMCRKGGRCQDHTEREHWIPPVFLRVNYHKHTMIIGIYDNSGEELSQMNLTLNQNFQMLLDEIYAQLYLFDPCDLNIVLPKKIEQNISKRLEDCKLLSIEEQGKEQKKNRGKRITGRELNEKLHTLSVERGDVLRALEVYNSYQSLLIKFGREERFSEMYFAGVIIKSDLLEHSKEIRAREEYDILFRRDIKKDMLDRDSMEMRNELVQKMIKDFQLFGTIDIDDFKRDFNEIDEEGNHTGRHAVSWHCISALGCGVDTPKLHDCGGVLQGDYAPIRVAEPLLTCILKRIVDNGWMEK